MTKRYTNPLYFTLLHWHTK